MTLQPRGDDLVIMVKIVVRGPNVNQPCRIMGPGPHNITGSQYCDCFCSTIPPTPAGPKAKLTSLQLGCSAPQGRRGQRCTLDVRFGLQHLEGRRL